MTFDIIITQRAIISFHKLGHVLYHTPVDGPGASFDVMGGQINIINLSTCGVIAKAGPYITPCGLLFLETLSN